MRSRGRALVPAAGKMSPPLENQSCNDGGNEAAAPSGRREIGRLGLLFGFVAVALCDPVESVAVGGERREPGHPLSLLLKSAKGSRRGGVTGHASYTHEQGGRWLMIPVTAKRREAPGVPAEDRLLRVVPFAPQGCFSAEIPGPHLDRLQREVGNIDVAGLTCPWRRAAGIGAAGFMGLVAATVGKREGLASLAYRSQQV